MEVSLPSYEAAMRDAREYLRRRDLSSQDEVPLYFAWERLYAAANANLSTDFFHETSAERRARQQARLSPRRGLPPRLLTSFDKVNRRSAQASSFLRSETSSDVAIEMMARRYRREAEKLRSSREKLGMRSLDGAGKRLKKDKRRRKSPELEVEELLEAFEHSQVLPEDKVRASAMAREKFDLAQSKSDEFGADLTATKAAELRKSSFSNQNPATSPSLSNVAGVAEFAARVTDWRMPSDIDATSPSSLLKKKGMSTSAKRLGDASEVRGSAPVEDGEGDMTFDTSLGSSGFEEDSAVSELSLETGLSSAAQMLKRRKRQDGAGEGKAAANQEQKNSKRAAPGTKPEDLSTAAANTDTNSTTAQQHLADDYDVLANGSHFQHKLVQLSHAVGDMQVRIQGKQIEVTFKGALGDTSNADAKEGEALASAISSPESTQPSVAQKLFDTTGSSNDEGDDRNDEGEDSVEQLMEIGISAKASQSLPRKQSSVRFADMESRGHSEHESSERKPEQHEQRGTLASSVLAVQGDPPQLIPSSAHSSGRSSTMTRNTIEAEPVRDEEFREKAGTNEELNDRSSSKLQRRRVNSDQERNGQDAGLDADAFRANANNRSPPDEASRNGAQESRGSTSQRQDPNEYQREQTAHTTRSDSAPAATEERDTRSDVSRGRAHSSSTGSQDTVGLNEQTHTRTDTQHDIQGDIFANEHTLQGHDQHRAQPRRETPTPTEKSDTRSQSSRSRTASSSSRRQDMHSVDEQTHTDTDKHHDVHSLQEHDEHRGQSRRDTTTATGRSDTRSESPRDSSEGTRSQDMLGLAEQTRLGTDKQDGVQGEIFTAEHSVQEHDQPHAPHRQSRTDTATATMRSDTRSQPSRGRVDSSESTRSHDIPGLDEQTRTNTDDVQRDIFIEEHSLHRANHRQSHKDTTTTKGEHERRPRTTRRESNAPRSRRDFEHSIEPSDDENGVESTNDGEVDSSDEVRIPRKRSSDRPNDRHTEHHRTTHPSRSTSSKTRERSTHRVPETHDRSRSIHEPRRSRNQREELVDDELYSDEELSDGPDTPYRRPQQQRGRHDPLRQQSWVSDDSRENSTQSRSKRLPSRSVPHVKSHSKRRSHSPESRADGDAMSSSDYDSLEEQSTERRSQPARNRRDQPQSSRKPTHKLSSRDHHFIPAMKYPPKLSKPDVRLKRDSKSRSEPRSNEGAGRPRKLPEGIVWPPGMEEECIARLGLDGHHPIAPPGLEHLVTEEQWGEYWTWLHWYSSWQMWYMKKGKKPTRKSEKDKRSGRRRADAYESPDNEEYHGKRANANWRLDVGPGKHHRRRS